MSMSAHIRFETKLITPACKPTTLLHSESKAKVSLNIASECATVTALFYPAGSSVIIFAKGLDS